MSNAQRRSVDAAGLRRMQDLDKALFSGGTGRGSPSTSWAEDASGPASTSAYSSSPRRGQRASTLTGTLPPITTAWGENGAEGSARLSHGPGPHGAGPGAAGSHQQQQGPRQQGPLGRGRDAVGGGGPGVGSRKPDALVSWPCLVALGIRGPPPPHTQAGTKGTHSTAAASAQDQAPGRLCPDLQH
ncbi:hypothetical protein TSOC_006828 [Tetrabaena socialis]|uniref:Uncharacterized protein n=1 Tax=Tetrabaena socialis TaxID=47790 RepID=A0A2J8A2J9_9CHLO|nr:hypothetical protein TSOC_006828 [Tetrabaena socialis]|eukprot:PNH06740.1 hypothetical protein TSOC_006828 [Tetrabaena socialis]